MQVRFACKNFRQPGPNDIIFAKQLTVKLVKAIPRMHEHDCLMSALETVVNSVVSNLGSMKGPKQVTVQLHNKKFAVLRRATSFVLQEQHSGKYEGRRL